MIPMTGFSGVVTMVQMIGVLVLAIGLPRMFASIEHGEHLDNSVMVLGYVIMRVAMVFQWLRAAKQDPARRRACLTYATAISIAQLGWVVLIFFDFSLSVTLILSCILALIEMAGPVLAERQGRRHALARPSHCRAPQPVRHHRAGRGRRRHARDPVGRGRRAGLDYGCGPGLPRRHGAHLRHVVGLLPAAVCGDPPAHRNRAFVWGYGQMLIVTSIVATGAGLHVAAYFIEDKAQSARRDGA